MEESHASSRSVRASRYETASQSAIEVARDIGKIFDINKAIHATLRRDITISIPDECPLEIQIGRGVVSPFRRFAPMRN